MTELPRGLYESLVTEELNARLDGSGPRMHRALVPLVEAEAADRIAWHISSVVERAVRMLPEDGRVSAGIELARRLIDGIVDHTGPANLARERPDKDGHVLRSIQGARPDGAHVGERPMAITWRLKHRLPGDLFQAFAAAVA